MRFSVLNPDAERRDGLKALLRQIDRHARFTELHDWHQAERALRASAPDLLVIDWQPWMGGADARPLFAHHPELRVAVITDDSSPAGVRNLIDEGVLGVIPRSTDPRLIVRALEIVMLGGHYVPAGAVAIDSPTREESAARPPDTACAAPPRTRINCDLSPRQQQIMRCVHMGSTNKMIARTLGISEGTVKIHLASIFQQLGAPNRAAAVAIYNGWLAAQLEVLRTEPDSAPRPVLGQQGVVPLRQRRGFRYPLPVRDNFDLQPLAAEPAAPFGEAAPQGGN